MKTVRTITIVFLISIILGIGGCRSGLETPKGANEATIVHVVLVWLKEPGNAEHRQQIIDGADKLRAIPGLLSLEAGEVIESDRPVVEDSYDVALMMRFASVEDMQVYLAHLDHINTVKTEFVPIMNRYRVMDFTTR